MKNKFQKFDDICVAIAGIILIAFLIWVGYMAKYYFYKQVVKDAIKEVER